MAHLKAYSNIISESASELELLVKAARDTTTLRRIQLLLLLKSGHTQTAEAAAPVVGYHPNHARHLLRKYEHSGLKALLTKAPAPKAPAQFAKQHDLDALSDAINQGKVQSSSQARQFLRDVRGLPYRSDSAVYRLLCKHQMFPSEWRRIRTKPNAEVDA